MLDIINELENDSLLTMGGNSATELYNKALQSPSVLIAGLPGSGKSVIANNLINHLIVNNELGSYGIMLCDPKRVEFNKYNTRKARNTFLIGYYNTAEKILSALQLAEKEMMRRYAKMEKLKHDKWQGRTIYIFIDEIADLVQDKILKKEFLRVVTRLLALGRASKIYIIMCTQFVRRSLLGNIPNLVNSVIGLRCNTALESRLIINTDILTTLPRYGECYYNSFEGLEHYDNIEYITTDTVLNNINSL